MLKLVPNMKCCGAPLPVVVGVKNDTRVRSGVSVFVGTKNDTYVRSVISDAFGY